MAKFKSLLSISQVFNLITPAHGKNSIVIIPGTNQPVPLSNNLIKLAQLSKRFDLECSVCGCHGTHLQRAEHGAREVWRVMAWSKSKQRQTFLNLDHIIPQSHGGTWDLDNLRITCVECNVDRGNTKIVVDGGEPCYTVKQLKHLVRMNNIQSEKKSSLTVRLEHFENRFINIIRSQGHKEKRIPQRLAMMAIEPAMQSVGFRLSAKFKRVLLESGV